MKIYAVGDIHGKNVVPQIRLKFEEALLQDPDSYIIFLGDYIDRGNHSLKVILDLLDFYRAHSDRVFFLVGNHEIMFMESIANKNIETCIYHNGAQFTVNSMGGEDWDTFCKNLNYYQKLCELMVGKIEIIIGSHKYRFTHAGPSHIK